jgi:hypothetical protein
MESSGGPGSLFLRKTKRRRQDTTGNHGFLNNNKNTLEKHDPPEARYHRIPKLSNKKHVFRKTARRRQDTTGDQGFHK